MRFWWLALCVFSFFTVSGCVESTALTTEEEEYVKTHIVNWAADENFQPFIFMDNGMPKGIAVDYLELICAKTGLKIRLEKSGQLETLLGMLRTGPVDMLSSIRTTPERSRYASFTMPFVYVDLVQLRRVSAPITAGVGQGYAVVNFLEIERKDLFLVKFANDEESLKAMIRGDVDSVVMDAASAKTLMKKYNVEFDELKIPFEYPLSFAVKKDNKILKNILDKALTSITPEEHERIRKKWM